MSRNQKSIYAIYIMSLYELLSIDNSIGGIKSEEVWTRKVRVLPVRDLRVDIHRDLWGNLLSQTHTRAEDTILRWLREAAQHAEQVEEVLMNRAAAIWEDSYYNLARVHKSLRQPCSNVPGCQWQPRTPAMPLDRPIISGPLKNY